MDTESTNTLNDFDIFHMHFFRKCPNFFVKNCQSFLSTISKIPEYRTTRKIVGLLIVVATNFHTNSISRKLLMFSCF